MKRILSLWGLLFVAMISAQTLTSTQNYIYSKTCLNDDCTKTSETVQYFDSFGRPYQSIGIKASPTGKDIVQHIPYDSFGRSVDSWNPVPMGTLNGAVQDSASVKSNAVTVYGDSRPFSHSVLEKSPLSRVTSQVSTGQDWLQHPSTMGYNANIAGEVKKYTVTTTWVEGRTESALSQSGTYAANTLMKNTVTDEDGNVSVQYKNKQGQLVMSRKAVGTATATDTYYVYNEYDQLVYVLPPLASVAAISTSNLDNLCYQYRYDEWNRVVEKKLPGKGWEYMVYNKVDQLIMSQDANMRSASNWMFIKYDQLGRMVYSGISTTSLTRQTLQTNAYANANVYESRNATGFTMNGMSVYYSNTATPVNVGSVLNINYYDTYPTGAPSPPTQVLGQNILADTQTAAINTKTLPLASYVKNIEDDNWTKNYNYYDTKGRLVEGYTINHLGGYTKVDTELDFAGVPKQAVTRHKRLDADTEKVIVETFTYDSQNRLLTHKHKVDANPEEILIQNTYNDLSQVTNKKVGGTVASSPLQSIDYKYNIKGWLTKINDPAALTGGKLFGYELKYTNPTNTTYSSAKYNGNIAEVDWKTASDNIVRRYSYRYDNLNRLQYGHYAEPATTQPSEDYFGESVEYDLNGNISRLYRNTKNTTNGLAMQIDNLTYNYTGNRLNSVTDANQNYGGYPDVSGNTIAYDDNGNMIDQKDKGILQIRYNYLNLPEYVKFDQQYYTRGVWQNVNTSYLYGADGTKLRKIYKYSEDSVYKQKTTEYLDGFQYEIISTNTDPQIKFVPTAEGYYNFENNKYIYNYTDHLGNVRLSYMNNGTGAQIIEENNYYPFGLKHDGYNSLAGNPSYQYKYNGKELQTESGMYDYGARMYMPELGRWGVMDPLAEQMRRYSPYNYAFNNPVNFTDPDGRKPQIYNAGGVMRWDFDPLTTIYGTSWFSGPDLSFSKHYAGSTMFAQGFTGGGGDGSDDDRTPFIGSDLYESALSALASLDKEYDFSQFDFTQFGLYNGPGDPIVQLLIWPGHEDVGHTAIRINGTVYGYYPTDINGDGRYTKEDLRNSPGEMHIDSENEFYINYYGNTVVSYDINISDSTAKNLENYLLNVAKSPGNYSLWGLNCTSVAIQAMEKSGISIYTSPTTYNRFDGEPNYHKLSNGFGISPNRLIEIMNNGLNNYLFYNRTKYQIK